MAIATVNASYVGQAPAKSGQIMIDSFAGDVSRRLFFNATLTGDGSDTNGTVNFIDGTEVLPFTPGFLLCSRNGGDAAATISFVGASSVTDTSFLATLSAAPANTATVILSCVVAP